MDFFTLIQKQDNNDPTLAPRSSEILEFGTEIETTSSPLDFELCKGLMITLD